MDERIANDNDEMSSRRELHSATRRNLTKEQKNRIYIVKRHKKLKD